MSESLNQQAEQAPADALNADGIDAAADAFAALDQPEPQANTEQPQAEPDPEPEGESDTDAEEADPEAEEPTEQLAEVEYEGKTYKVPPELEKALLRQSDYSRKMNEVGAKEKAYTQRLEAIEGVEKAAEKRAEAMAQVAQLDQRIKQFGEVNWQEMRQNDPANAAMLAVEMLSLQQMRESAVRGLESVEGEFRAERQKVMESLFEDRNKALDKDLPGWREEAFGLKLTQYAASKGIKPEKLAQVTDAGLIVALDKARRYDELQASKPALKAKAAQAAPVTKPGAPRKVDAKTEALAKHRKSGSIDSAAEAFLAMGR